MDITFQEAFIYVAKNKTSFTAFDISDLRPEFELEYIEKELEHLNTLGIIELDIETIQGKQYKLK